MRSTRQLSITLPNEMAEMVRAKVESGEYASESEVIRDGLRSLRARDLVFERWLQEQVAPAHDALARDPRRAIAVDDVKADLLKATGRARRNRSR
jgi:putative addiction module CopG family antidote